MRFELPNNRQLKVKLFFKGIEQFNFAFAEDVPACNIRAKTVYSVSIHEIHTFRVVRQAPVEFEGASCRSMLRKLVHYGYGETMTIANEGCRLAGEFCSVLSVSPAGVIVATVIVYLSEKSAVMIGKILDGPHVATWLMDVVLSR